MLIYKFKMINSQKYPRNKYKNNKEQMRSF